MAAASPTLPDIAARLGSLGGIAADARYEVYLPGADTPVVYEVRLLGMAVSDSLSPYAYITSWKTPVGNDGFSAYFDGNYYSYDGNNRLREYHMADDSTPFAPLGNPSAGVQQADRFARLLPQFIANELMAIATDTTYVYDISENSNTICVKGKERRKGYDIREFEYRFADNGTRPVSIEYISSPGQMSEQTISVTYSPSQTDADHTEMSESTLISLFPDAFEKYRSDNFSLESLRGGQLPEFAARTVTRERYIHDCGSDFAAPTVIAILDYDVDATAETVTCLRDAIGSMPSAFDLILAFTGNDTDRIEEITLPARAGETVLVSARSLARDFGVADTPSLIFVRRNGTVADIHIGRNNNLKEIVIQKAAMTK